MAAAIEASKSPQNKILLFERQSRVGRKLLSTGNGRCNLTNTGASLENYHGQNPAFALPVLCALPPEKILEFFLELGLVTTEEYGGRVYPMSNSANSVVDVLRFALNRENIELLTGAPVTGVKRSGKGFTILTDQGTYAAQSLIIACGGCAGARLGGVKDGYELLKSLGHRRTGLFPSLVQITTDPTYPRALKGVRCQAALRLSGCASGESSGELQFTEKGVSGPAAFDLSRRVSVSGDGKKFLHIDFLGTLGENELKRLIKSRKEALPALSCQELLTGVLHNKIGQMVIKYAEIPQNQPISALNSKDIEKIASACQNFVLPVRGTEGFDSAQVTAGGMDTAQFNPETLESLIVPGLFACGEVLDIDGDCGGYNLQWAFASGITAGRLQGPQPK